MLIGIEASRANRPQKTGVEWYAWRVIKGMEAIPEAKDHSWLLYTNALLERGLQDHPTNWHETQLRWPPKYLWTQIRLSWELSRHPPEVLFVPAHVLPRVTSQKSVVTIHDVGFHRYPQLYPSRQVRYHEWSTRDIVKRAAKIITVSEFSKQELIDGYQADPNRIFVTPLGVDQAKYRPQPLEQTDPVLQKFQIAQPFLIFVGRLEAKKNIHGLIDAFIRYKQQAGVGDPLTLVLAGIPGRDWFDSAQMLRRAGLEDQVRVLGYISEDEKIALLSRALALVHPAWYEGFGLTPLEAMACGCPVLCSKVASLPEVVGDENAIWFDPTDTDTITKAIDLVVRDADQRLHLVDAGLSHVKSYTWERTARQTFDLLTNW